LAVAGRAAVGRWMFDLGPLSARPQYRLSLRFHQGQAGGDHSAGGGLSAPAASTRWPWSAGDPTGQGDCASRPRGRPFVALSRRLRTPAACGGVQRRAHGSCFGWQVAIVDGQLSPSTSRSSSLTKPCATTTLLQRNEPRPWPKNRAWRGAMWPCPKPRGGGGAGGLEQKLLLRGSCDFD